MANWIECKPYGSGPSDDMIFINLDQVVSLSGTNEATVVRYAGGENSEFVVIGSPRDLLKHEKVR